jgi:hypothetical protein
MRPGNDGLVMVGQVPGEGVGAGVQALFRELLAEPDDQFDGLGAERGR